MKIVPAHPCIYNPCNSGRRRVRFTCPLPKAVIASDRRERGNLNLLSKGEIASVTLFLRNDTKTGKHQAFPLFKRGIQGDLRCGFSNAFAMILSLAGVVLLLGCLPLAARSASISIEQLLESGKLDSAKTAIEATGDAASRSYWRSKLFFYEGDYFAAEREIDAALACGSPESSRHLKNYYHALGEIHRQAVETESAHFRFRAQGADVLLSRYALDCLENACQNIGGMLADMSDQPAEKVLVEVYPLKEDFSLGSTLDAGVLEKSGTVGICKFNRIMILSPGALPLGYSWLDTLSHEYVHFLVNRVSGGKCPLWLHEGIARYHETLWRSITSEYLTADAQNRLSAARKKKSFIPFKRMHPSIVYLKDRDEMSLAFAEVSAAVDFMRQAFGGEDALRRLLRAMAEADYETSFTKTFGISVKVFEKRFHASVNGMTLAESRGVMGDQAQFRKVEDEEYIGADQRGLIRLGDRMRQAGRPDGALLQYEKALAAEPDNPVILLKAARASSALGNGRDAEKSLRQAIAKNTGYVTPYQALGELYYAGGEYAKALTILEQALAINPFNPETHRYLSRCYLAGGDRRNAVYELQATLALDPADAGTGVLLDRMR